MTSQHCNSKTKENNKNPFIHAKFVVNTAIKTDLLQRKQTWNDYAVNFRFVIATSAESNMSLVTTVTCLTLSIKSFPLIRVNVYEMAREVGEERGTKRKESVRRKTVKRSGAAGDR